MVDKEKIEPDKPKEPPVDEPPDGGTEFPAEGDSSALTDPEVEETEPAPEEADE